MSREWDEIARRNPFYGIFAWPAFEDASQVDEERFWESGRIQVETFLKKIDLESTDRLDMLEIGCGIGRMTHRFADFFRTVIAVDVSQEMIDRARARWGQRANIRFLRVNGEGLGGVPDAAVDFAFSFLVLQHITASEIVLRYLDECARVLRPGGIAFVQLRTRSDEPAGCAEQPSMADLLRRMLLRAARALRSRLRPPSEPREDRWWSEGLWRFRESENPERTEAIRQLAVWQGCAVSVASVVERCAASGLIVHALDGAGSQYTFLRAVKPG